MCMQSSFIFIFAIWDDSKSFFLFPGIFEYIVIVKVLCARFLSPQMGQIIILFLRLIIYGGDGLSSNVCLHIQFNDKI